MRRIIDPLCRLLKEKLPELNFVDIDLEQLKLEDPPVDFPCALVDVESARFRSATGCRTGEVVVKVTFGFKVYGPSDMGSPEELREMALEHYDIVRRATDLLHGFSSAEFTPLNCTDYLRGAQTYPRTITLAFTTQIKDQTGRSFTRAQADPVIDPSIRR